MNNIWDKKMFRKFADRKEAGRALADALQNYADRPGTVILALPRGGVPIADEVARALHLPMDIWLVRKLGVPGHEELAMGAMALNGTFHINRDIARAMDISPQMIKRVVEREREELARRNKLYRQGRRIPSVKGKTVIVVDDGLATGATMKAAIESLREEGVGRIVVAVPVGATSSCEEIDALADELVCLFTPEPFYGVGQWYRDFSQTSDQEVQDILAHQEVLA